MNELNVITFDENDKWAVIYEKRIDEKDYSYLAKLNDSENGITGEYKVFKSEYSLGDEYMEEVTDKEELNRVIPLLVDGAQDYIDNPEKLSKLIEGV